MSDEKTWKIVATREDAEEFSDTIGIIGAGWWRQIALGQRLGVPEALGLTTQQWVHERLGGYVKMSIEDRRKAVKELAADGHSNVAVGSILGVDEAQIRRDKKSANAEAPKENGNETNDRAIAESANAEAPKENDNKNNEPPVEASPNGEPPVLDAAAAIIADDKIHAAIETGKKRDAKEKQRKADLERPVTISLVPGLHHGDFRKLSSIIEDNSVQLVFTDPPYDADSVPLYGDAARVAARILKDGGSFITYSGQRHLFDAMSACMAHLDYLWLISGKHGGDKNLLKKLGIRCGWKPLLWFIKGTRGDVQKIVYDVITGEHEKAEHEWQQSLKEAKYYIENLTSPGGRIVDFFAGSGTTAIAAKSLRREWIGFEINAATAEKATERVRRELEIAA